MTLFLIMMERAGLIILLAYAFVHIPFIKQTLKQPELKKHQYILLILFSLFAIISNFTGVEIQSDLSIIPQTLNHIADQSSVANTRVLTIGVSGLIGGPIVGIIVGLLSVFVRYLQGGLAPHIYVISSLLIGLCSGLSGNYLRKNYNKIRVLDAMVVGFGMEILQMICILIFSVDFNQALRLVSFISMPMILSNTLGLGIFISIISSTQKLEEHAKAFQTHQVLELANLTLPYLRKGLTTESCQPVAEIIHKHMDVSAVSLTSQSAILAYVGDGADHHLPNTQILTKLAKRAIDTGKVSVATDKSEIECDHNNCPLSSAIVIPLHIHDVIVGTLKLYFSDAQHMTYVDRQLAEGLGNIFSTQLALGQVEEATRLLQDAEMKSLQAQVNPHFLFNALNTIYGLIRMDSEKARKLVQDFSKVIRANLQRAKQNLIPLHDELEQVNAYLALEEARFPNMVAFNLDNQTNSDDNLMIPPFTLQVLIENSYKHAFKHVNKNNQLKVTITRNNDRLHIIVQDNGIGIPKEKLITLGKKTQISKQGSGTAIENLVRRLNIIYDGQASLKFESNDSGTCAIVNIPIKS
ncbi:TPA: LytS/YhcK type 5TM receptor domain-containing protein [Streptococcus agalactiae]